MNSHLHVRVGMREAVFGSALGEIWVGSGRDCAIRLESVSVAPRHLVLRFDGDAWHVENLASAQPVFSAGQPIGTAVIAAPLELRFGDALSGPLLHIEPVVPELGDATADFESGPTPVRDAGTRAADTFALAAGVVR